MRPFGPFEIRNALSVRHKRIPHDRLWQFSLIPLIITSAFCVVIRHTHARHLTLCVDRLKCISQVQDIYICISTWHVGCMKIRIMRTTQQWAPYRAVSLHASHAATMFSTLHQQTHTDSIGLRCAAPSLESIDHSDFRRLARWIEPRRNWTDTLSLAR